MSNSLVGDVYQKIIDEVIAASKSEFEENGVHTNTLDDMAKEWKNKLTARDVAHMPWQPKPEPPPPAQQTPNPAASLPSATNGLPPSYAGYNQQSGLPNGASRIKPDPGSEAQYHGLPNGYPPNPLAEGGQVRAQQLTQQYAQARGLALPGQRPQGMQQPSAPSQQQAQQHAQQMYLHQQRQQQQAALQQQQAQPRIKVENDSPQLNQGGFQHQHRQPNPAYAQTDGANDGLEEWQAMMVERRAVSAEARQRADRMMRDHIAQMSSDLESGLMVPLDEQPGRGQSKKRRIAPSLAQDSSTVAGPSIPQLDGLADEDDKPVKDEDDEDAINSDLDSDNDPTAELDDDEEEFGDAILCTYDKVQRVKNKWKCTLKDGVMSINRKEWVFHKGTGEFEW